MRVADAAAAILRLREIAIHDLREEAIRPVGMRAGAARVDLLHLFPDADTVVEDRHFKHRDAQAGHVEDVLGVMQERHLIVIAADQQDLAERSSIAAQNGATVLISNHYTDLTKKLYGGATELVTVMVQRMISCDGDNRKKTMEVIAIFRPKIAKQKRPRADVPSIHAAAESR